MIKFRNLTIFILFLFIAFFSVPSISEASCKSNVQSCFFEGDCPSGYITNCNDQRTVWEHIICISGDPNADEYKFLIDGYKSCSNEQYWSYNLGCSSTVADAGAAVTVIEDEMKVKCENVGGQLYHTTRWAKDQVNPGAGRAYLRYQVICGTDAAGTYPSYSGVPFGMYGCIPEKKVCEDFYWNDMECPPPVTSLQIIVVRVFTALLIIVGLVFLYAIIRAAIMIMTAGGDQEKVAAGRKAFSTAIIALVGAFVVYILLIFISMRFGIAGRSVNMYSFTQTNRLIFDFMLPD